MIAPLPVNEAERLRILQLLQVEEEPRFQNAVELAAELLKVPVSLVSLVYGSRQCFPTRYGVEITETPREVSFCAHAILTSEPLVVDDATLDPRFLDNELVTGDFHVRAYAGVPLIVGGVPIGALCVIDTEPRSFEHRQIKALTVLAEQVSATLEAKLQTLYQAQLNEEVKASKEVLHENNLKLESKQHELSVALDNLRIFSQTQAASARRFEGLFQSVPVSCFTFDLEGRIFEWNRESERAFGLLPQEVFEQPIAEAIGHSPNSPWQDMLHHILEEGQNFGDREWCREICPGDSQFFLSRAFPLKDAYGKVIGGLCASVNITARKRAEAELTIAVEALKGAEALAKIGNWSYDPELGAGTWSEGLYQVLGLDPCYPPLAFDAFVDRVHHEDRERYACDLEAIRAGRLIQGEYRYLLPSGEIRNLAVISQRVPSSGMLVGTIQDVTESRAAARLVEEREAQLRTTMDAMHEGLVLQDHAGKIVMCNTASEAILGLTKDQILGKRSIDQCWHCIRPDGSELPNHLHPAMVALATAQVQRDVVMGVALPDGGIHWLQVTSVPLTNANGTAESVVSTFVDITESRKTTEALLESRARLIEAEHLVRAGNFEFDLVSGQATWSEALYDLLQVPRDESNIHYNSLMDLVHPDDWEQCQTDRSIYHTRAGKFERVFRVLLASEEVLHVRMVACTHLKDGRPVRIIGTLLDITDQVASSQQIEEQMVTISDYATQLEVQQQELVAANEMLQKLAKIDGLTGVANHRALQDFISFEIDRTARYGNPFSVVMIDVDHFKAFNDEFGHPAGDALLIGLADALNKQARTTDLAARYGGEEFMLALPETTCEEAFAVAERLRKTIESLSGFAKPVTISLGVATIDPATMTRETLIAQADEALYESKKSGRNRTTLHRAKSAA